MLGGTFVREHMPVGRTIMHGGAYVHNMPTQEFHVDAVACVTTVVTTAATGAAAKIETSPLAYGYHPTKQHGPLPTVSF